MPTFANDREAKEFLVSLIAAEAGRTGGPLSETERKMLYFSETGWTLPEIWEVNEAFEKQYDDGEYEEKIAGVIRSFHAQASAEEEKSWREAVRILNRGDHYLLVMVGIASGELRSSGLEPSPVTGKQLLGFTVAVFFICAIAFLLARPAGAIFLVCALAILFFFWVRAWVRG